MDIPPFTSSITKFEPNMVTFCVANATQTQADWKMESDEEEALRSSQTAQVSECVRVVLRGYAIADGHADRVLVRASHMPT